jgi:hypothetical protein
MLLCFHVAASSEAGSTLKPTIKLTSRRRFGGNGNKRRDTMPLSLRANRRSALSGLVSPLPRRAIEATFAASVLLAQQQATVGNVRC